ncbi:hypothetical protein L0B52_01080 [Suttonella sp. R2A3]|uniref:hypothetical protein n=1 Tax=Suttonella sp. R2A3 TaxID=2908648 RepID=UPI001F2B88EF|nr:hypothetical protein [Suttonella sp. R2A3]UJF24761.1 hypothetical protein L0B52_01080 [Suttonella sp. R2A3]
MNKNHTVFLIISSSAALLLTACVSHPSAFQQISDAQAALTSAQDRYQDITCEQTKAPQPICAELAQSKTDLRAARQALKSGDEAYAKAKAESVLKRAQQLIRRGTDVTN